MYNQPEPKEIILQKVEYSIIIWGVICLISLIFGFNHLSNLLLRGDTKTQIFAALLYIILVAIVFKALYKVFGRTSLAVENDTLYIKQKILFLTLTKRYLIQYISNLQLGKNADSSSAWGFQGVSIYGKVFALSFNYNGKEKQIKGNLSENDFTLLKRWLRK